MAEGRFKAADIKGRTPGLDPTQSKELFALEGKNYTFDSLGVKSPFGNRLLTPVSFTRPEHAQGVRLRLRGGDRCFTLLSDGVHEWDEDKGGFRTIYQTPDLSVTPYRWTHQYLNGQMYFAHPSTGLLVLNLDTGICAPHEDVAKGTLPRIMAVSENNGRLVVMTDELLGWSAPSNGLDFTPGFGGAGFQKIAERVAGDPILAMSYARGVMTWTSGGIMRAEFTGDVSVFRFRTLNTEYRPINSFCMARVDEDTVIFLDERGLFQSRGEAITPYAPVFNEFLINFLQDNKYRDGVNVRLEWDDRKRYLFVSYSDSYSSPLYEKCFVYYPPLDKWGEFNESHYGILPFRVNRSERSDDYFGFVDESGRPRYWRGGGAREAPVESATKPRTSNLYRPVIQKPTQSLNEESGMVLSSSAKLSGFSRAGISRTEGYYSVGSTSPVNAELVGLDSLFRFGLLRIIDDGPADAMGEVTSVLVRSVKSGDSDILKVDFNLVPDGTADEDFNLLFGFEDKGLSPLNYINHTLEVVGTVDGGSDFVREAPTLATILPEMRSFACSVPGIWHIVEIGAESVGEAYHLHTFELTATNAGRYL
jgi:hypothetical protein